jgi:hypothetical protein
MKAEKPGGMVGKRGVAKKAAKKAAKKSKGAKKR